MSLSRKSSWAERKVARQRQMELMEAVASGTAPTMELDVSFDTEHNIRPRIPDVPYVRAGGTTSSAASFSSSAIPSSEIFERPSLPGHGGVNLMDHRTGVYREPPTFSENLSHAMTSVRDLFGRPDLYDASPSEEYIGQIQPTVRKKRMSPVTLACLSFLQRYSACLVAASIIIIFLIVFTSVWTITKPVEKRQYQQNVNRHTTIQEQIATSAVSSSSALANMSSPEFHALRWVAFSDPGRVAATDPHLLTRYALAVFYYSSYQAFQELAGEQAPIVKDLDTQWEGVPNPGWRRRDYWMSAYGYCEWYGITCAPIVDAATGQTVTKYDQNGDIVSLDLTGNYVYGTLPPEFKAMENLTYLGLAENKMRGSFPPQLGRMNQLQHLLLNGNLFSSSLPTWIGYLDDLRELHLENNKLTGTIPSNIGKLYNLQYLSLAANLLNGAVPDLSNCKVLSQLDLSDNLITGSLPTTLCAVTSLTELNLSNNTMGGSLPSAMSRLSNLEILDLDDNAFTGALPVNAVANWMKLLTLKLQFNKFGSTLPANLGDSTVLQSIDLSNNQFTGQIPVWSELGHVTDIHLNFNQLNGTIPSTWSGMTTLKQLWLDHNKLTGPVPSELGAATSLQVAYLDNNMLTGTVPTYLGQLTHLESLRLDANGLAGQVPESICQLTKEHSLRALTADCKDPSKIQCACCSCH